MIEVLFSKPRPKLTGTKHGKCATEIFMDIDVNTGLLTVTTLPLLYIQG